MENSRFVVRGCRLAASLRGERLWLAPDLRSKCVAEMTPEAGGTAGVRACFRVRDFRTGTEADRRAFARSVACERLAVFQLLLGHPAAAYVSLCDAACEALCGEEYDHGDVSLPARFLRIRFYHLWDRLLALRASEPRLHDTALDPWLFSQARRLGGRWL